MASTSITVQLSEADRALLQDTAKTLLNFLDYSASAHDTVFCRMTGEGYAPTQYTDETDNNIYLLIDGYLKSKIQVRL